MKKIIVFNVLFCLVVIAVCSFYYDSKAKEKIVYNYVAEHLEIKYELSRENLDMDIQYRIGPGLYEVLVLESETEKEYFFEVDISEDYALHYFKDLTFLYNRKDTD